MSVSKEREAILQVYKSDSWAYKVSKMSDSQVVAIYIRLKAEGKL